MAWDTTKSPGDIIASADYNSMVTDQKTRGIPQSEEKRGTDCTGTSGTANRTLTLAATPKTSGVVITVSGRTMHEGAGKDYTFTGAVITFLNPLFDTDYIRAVYFI